MKETFNQQGYVYLPDFLDKENCFQYVQEFQKLIQVGQTSKDHQCPLSHSLGHTALFDSLLEQLTPHIEQATGKKLFPTYAYARWYAPGDELKIHRDRPSCEISATITLGFEGNPWPIYMGYDENKINCNSIPMKVGDAVIYQGEKLYHWREKYVEGQWQAQVFIHYVDQNGPNAEWKYDKRPKLAHHTDKKLNWDGSHVVRQKAFPIQTCQSLIKNFESYQDKIIEGGVGHHNQIDKDIRDVKKIIQENDVGLGATLTGIGLQANYHYWKYNITHSNQSEYLRYDKEGHYQAHIDTFLESKEGDQVRKLTILLFLNNEFEGGKLFLKTGHNKFYPPQEPGDVLIFPSFILHGVEPVISGIRRTVVTWLVGTPFK